MRGAPTPHFKKTHPFSTPARRKSQRLNAVAM
jgi:hypothetical protein